MEKNNPSLIRQRCLYSPDHYVTRLIHASGVPLDQLRVGGTTAVEPRIAWRSFCKAWPLFDGTASGYWLRSEFVNLFGLDDNRITEENSDAIYDAIQAKLDEPGFRPRQLFKDFKIEVLATTDDPLDGLSAHPPLLRTPASRAGSCRPSAPMPTSSSMLPAGQSVWRS